MKAVMTVRFTVEVRDYADVSGLCLLVPEYSIDITDLKGNTVGEVLEYETIESEPIPDDE